MLGKYPDPSMQDWVIYKEIEISPLKKYLLKFRELVAQKETTRIVLDKNAA